LATCRRLFPLRSTRCAFFSEPRARYRGPVCSAAVHFPGFLLWCKVIVIAAGPWPLPVRLSVWTRLFPRRNPNFRYRRNPPRHSDHHRQPHREILRTPITHDTIKAMDLRQIKVHPEDFGMISYDPAYNNTASCISHITYIDGDKGSCVTGAIRSRSWRRNPRISRPHTCFCAGNADGGTTEGLAV